MSWAEEDWTVGLSGRVLQKVKELQIQQERLSREVKQKQLQLDNIHTSHEKQTKKYEEVRGELQSVQRELQSVQEEAKAAVTRRECLSQELQTKQAQVCSLEGQLDSARTLNNKLTQEVKRLEAELEKLQNSCRSADTTLFSTPCWNTSSPWEQNGSRKEERSGQRDEGQSRGLHIRQRLQFSDNPTASLPRQQYKSTPQSESFSTPSAAFPWERDDSMPAARRRSPSSPQTPFANVISEGQSEQGVCGREEPTAETNKSLSEIQSQVSSLEEELSGKDSMLRATQSELMQCKRELTAKELNLQKAHTRITQESERASGTEQRLKQVQEELKCQRQNADSSRLQHQQRIKDLEKQHQRDLMEFQKERQSLEKQHQQEMNKLNQELQQARTLHNGLQAQTDKLSLQKQALDKELDALKEKLKWTEGQLQESLKKETQTKAKLTEAVREAEGVAVSLEQSRKKERVLEEEGKRLAEERADALRLLKELQEQKAAPPLQPVQFCPVGQSFTPQPSYSLHSRPSAHTKRPTASTQAEWKREETENMDEIRVEVSSPYPTDREPGEGIDSEHITEVTSPNSESSQKGGHRKISNEEENKSRNEAQGCDSSGTEKHSTFDQVISASTPCSDGTNTNISMDDNHCSPMLSAEKGPLCNSEQTKDFEDLMRENAMLRSELHDVREDLQKRLEDLETQRRAETEARTRLKQLSRKHAAQAVEKEEKDKEWRVQLEGERAEAERLRKAISTMQAEMKRSKDERENERKGLEEGKSKALEDRESEMIELNIQLKKQLAEVKAQLALEREDRKMEEERNQIFKKDMDLKEQFITEMAELKAEYDQIKHSRKEDKEEDKVFVSNSPLTYLTLHDDELNSNIVDCDNKCLPSPEHHVLFCQSANQRNMLVSQAAADLIQEERTVTDPEFTSLSGKGQTGQVIASSEDTRQKYLSSLLDHRKLLSNYTEGDLAVSDLGKEVERLQKVNAKETERAKQYQVKLEALQNQVTRQTQQLTMAFERQSQHISGLLVELQEKENALLSQGEELQHYKQELNALKAQKDQEESNKTEAIMVKKVENGETQDERLGLSGVSGLQTTPDKECADTLADYDSNAEREGGQPKMVTPSPVSSEEANEQHPGSVISDRTQTNHDSACVTGETEWSQDGGTGDVVAELLTLRQENQLLTQRVEALTISGIRQSALQTDSENREATLEQSNNTGNVAQSCLMEQRVLTDVTTGGQEFLQQNDRRVEDEEKKDRTTWAEEECTEVSQLHIDHLEQQVVALQMKVRALSEQNQEQAQELTVWRLASQPAPAFNRIHHSTDVESGTPNQISAVTQSQSATDDTNQAQEQTLGPEESLGNVTVIREDELFLSCSSNHLHGHMLFSRLQHNNLPEPTSLQPSKKLSGLLKYSLDITVAKESEKENHEISFCQQSDTCTTQHKEKTNIKLIQMPSETMGQHVTKDLHEVLGSATREPSECHTGDPEAKPDISRQTTEINTARDSSNKYISIKTKSVSSQTEDSLYPHRAPAYSELHCVHTQTAEEEDDEDSHVPLSDNAESGDKVLFSGAFPIPADPARLAERIRRNRTQLSAAFDDTEYEPYGLPEVVMKGFADIPTGPSCPYIVRRGLLGTTAVPVPQKNPGQEETD